MIQIKRLTLPLTFVSLAACAPDATEAPIVDTAETTQGAMAPIDPICLPPLVNVDARRSLTVTDHNVIRPSAGGRDFSLRRVLAQLASQAGEPGGADELFKQFWDTQNPAPSLNLGFNCADSSGNPSIVNGFEYGCRSNEGDQATINASANLDAYDAVSLVNRFDLAPADGSNCGEYRIVFDNGAPGRAFIIMEGVLPNPNPRCGIAACRPVQQMWADLTTISDANTRADMLEEFYFDGISGFAPVVDYHHFLLDGGTCGYGECDTGQFRTNAFLDRPWMLKEFKLERSCKSFIIKDPAIKTISGKSEALALPTKPLTRTICDLDFEPVSVKDNPFPDFFDPSSTHPLATDFVNHIDDQVACLAVNDVNRFGYCALDNVYNDNQSAALASPSTDYRNIFGGGGGPLEASIQGALTSIGSSLTPANIVARAEALSCKGCHQHTNNADMGGGITFPASDFAGFVHNTEFAEAGPDGQRFRISPALTGTFLPFREGIMEAYLSQSACVACGSVSLQSTTAMRTMEGSSAPAATTISGARAIH